ncbi:Uncharacterised protein [Moraxella lacunata]|uniref:Uncharacterized protein n=1 Tax=Moraxella lacunata TaxID=477 RepID=A0A1V4GT91_MORLA|nr:hypothetical protein [Moraxella lacunata]OPH35854.1 hypothetical protein B5J94_08560 [Moraxella lacunata]STZ00652.1 Uncharacterised protein [Moraxella lacunata]
MDYLPFQLPQDIIDKCHADPTTKKPENDSPRMDTMLSLSKWQWDITKTTKASKKVNHMFKSLLVFLTIIALTQNAYALTEESLCKLSSYIKILKYK